MRVLMFGWEFPPFQAGGLATATVGLVKGLLRNRASVTLVVPFPAEASPLPGLRLVGADGPADRLQLHRIPSPLPAYGGEETYQEVLSTVRQASRARSQVYGANLFEEVERFAGLAGAIAGREPHDVIDTHDWITFAAGIEAKRVSGRPLIAHIHATEFDRAGEGANPVILERERAGLSAADRVVANSHALKRTCVERFGIPASKIDVVHWGIDPEGLPNAPSEPSPLKTIAADGRVASPPTVLFLGRVTRQKGPDYFIEVAGLVSRLVPEAHFVIAGTGDLLPAVIRRAAELDIADRVHFAGPVQGAEVTRLYRLADVCVMPSVSEPFGLVALESLRLGTPCIMPRNAGAAEVIANAFKVDFWDVEEMTNKIVALLRHVPLRQELSDNGRVELSRPRFGLEEPARLTLASYRRGLTPTGGTS
jgi:glycosyltransferase involved in cell wall biosynthesis